MRVGLIVMAMLCLISSDSFAQQWQTLFSVDSRLGYSSNTYLNPFSSEWDRTMNSAYGVVSGMGHTAWFDSLNTVEITGGAFFEPYISNGSSVGGAYAMGSYKYSFTSTLSGGFEAGGSLYSSSFSRTLYWIQPAISWLPTPFTKVKAKAGSNFRFYDNYTINGVTTDSRERTDLYSLELETWPSFRWQLTAALYGDLDVLPAVDESFSSQVTGAYTFDDGSRLRLIAGLQQYKNEQSTTLSGGGGGMPVGGPPTTTQVVEQTNRIYRLGLEGSKPINERFTAFANIEGIRFKSSATGQAYNDIQLSGGVRMMINPARETKRGAVSPNWNARKEQHKVVIHYSGQGQLYLVGDFNNWNKPGIPLVNTEKKRFVAQLELEAGSYEYKILRIAGGEENWLDLSSDTYTVDDGFGGENALLLVE